MCSYSPLTFAQHIDGKVMAATAVMLCKIKIIILKQLHQVLTANHIDWRCGSCTSVHHMTPDFTGISLQRLTIADFRNSLCVTTRHNETVKRATVTSRWVVTWRRTGRPPTALMHLSSAKSRDVMRAPLRKPESISLSPYLTTVNVGHLFPPDTFLHTPS